MSPTPDEIARQIAELEADRAHVRSERARAALDAEIADLRSRHAALLDISGQTGDVNVGDMAAQNIDKRTNSVDVRDQARVNQVIAANHGVVNYFGTPQPLTTDPPLDLPTATRAYLEWLRNEASLRYLPIIPIEKRQDQLLLEDVYVPLRVVEHHQIAGFRRVTLGDFDPGGEYRLRQEAFKALEQSELVYRLLSDPKLLAQAEGRFSEPSNEPVRPRRDGSRQRNDADLPAPIERLVIIGDAGSGKTSTLHYGALALARDWLAEDPQSAREQLGLHLPFAPVPFYIRLTLIATYVRERYRRANTADLPGLDQAPATLLLEWLDGYIHAQKVERVPHSFASTAIRTGGCFILLDGLDETGDARERDYMQRLIVNLAQACPNNRYLVSSRPYDGLNLTGFADYHLSPLNRDEVKLLLENWFGAIRRQNGLRRAAGAAPAADEVAYLLGILDDSPRLFEMATNPLLLTTMALLVYGGATLPRERAELYNRLVPLLIRQWRETQMSGGKPPGQQAEAQLYETESDSSVQRRLQELAAWMQEQQRREIRLAEAQNVLRPIYRALMRHQGWNDEQCDDRVARLLGSLELHSGLIQGRDRGYSFAHYTIQEYLTARAYDRRADGVSQLLVRAQQPRWQETILLAVGHWATQGPTERAQELLGALLDTATLPGLQLVATALDDADAGRVPELAELRSRTIDGLHANAFHPATCPDPVQRARCAELLDRLGADTERPGLDLTQDAYWAARIESGTFSMSDNNRQFDYTIQRPYALARYPVTNRQYLVFMEALDGRGTLEAVAAAQQLLTLLEQRKLTPEQIRPRHWPGKHYHAGEGNHPVVGVTWYAATAFAWWANAWLYGVGVLAHGEEVRLPIEPEWERTVAYPVEIPGTLRYGLRPTHGEADQAQNTRTGRREYPWDAWTDLTETTANLKTSGIPANTEESRINDTSPVGIFPHGAAACGAEELAGNVWEWCASAYQKYPLLNGLSPKTLDNTLSMETYVLRGGSFRNNQGDARCTARSREFPDRENNNRGFRLARLFSVPSS